MNMAAISEDSGEQGIEEALAVAGRFGLKIAGAKAVQADTVTAVPEPQPACKGRGVEPRFSRFPEGEQMPLHIARTYRDGGERGAWQTL